MTDSLGRFDGIEVRPCQYGRGVFATRAFEVDELVERCPVYVIPEDHKGWLGRIKRFIGHCTMNWPDGDTTAQALMLGYGSLYNHSDDPNVEAYLEQDRACVTFYCIKPVSAGDELVFDYDFTLYRGGKAKPPWERDSTPDYPVV